MTPVNETIREEFERWIPGHNEAPIVWIGHSYANAYMAAQWEGFQAAWKLQSEYAQRGAVKPIMIFTGPNGDD